MRRAMRDEEQSVRERVRSKAAPFTRERTLDASMPVAPFSGKSASETFNGTRQTATPSGRTPSRAEVFEAVSTEKI